MAPRKMSHPRISVTPEATWRRIMERGGGAGGWLLRVHPFLGSSGEGVLTPLSTPVLDVHRGHHYAHSLRRLHACVCAG